MTEGRDKGRKERRARLDRQGLVMLLLYCRDEADALKLPVVAHLIDQALDEMDEPDEDPGQPRPAAEARKRSR